MPSTALLSDKYDLEKVRQAIDNDDETLSLRILLEILYEKAIREKLVEDAEVYLIQLRDWAREINDESTPIEAHNEMVAHQELNRPGGRLVVIPERFLMFLGQGIDGFLLASKSVRLEDSFALTSESVKKNARAPENKLRKMAKLRRGWELADCVLSERFHAEIQGAPISIDEACHRARDKMIEAGRDDTPSFSAIRRAWMGHGAFVEEAYADLYDCRLPS